MENNTRNKTSAGQLHKDFLYSYTLLAGAMITATPNSRLKTYLACFVCFVRGGRTSRVEKRRDRVKDHLTNWNKCLAEASIICRRNTFSPASRVCSSWINQHQRARPRRSRGCCVVWHQFWLTVTWIVSPSVPRLKIAWSEMYTCLIYVFGAINSHTSSGLAIRLLFLHTKQQASTD